MKANNAARVQTKQQLERIITKLTEHQKRRPLREVGEGGPPAVGAAGGAPSAAGQAAGAGPGGPGQAPIKSSPAPTDAGQQEQPAESEEGVPTLKSIIDQLNSMRAGRSLKDQEVQGELQRYFDGLEDPEKEALHAYLKGISQIVSGQVDAGSAEEPAQHGVEAKETGKKTRTIKPNVIRKAAAPKPLPANAGAAAAQVAATPPRENTTPPKPIVPKKR